MTTDLDDLLRRTLDGRAGTVTSGPAWDGAPARRSRAPWIAAAAAAVAVLGVSGGVAYLGSGGGHTAQPGGGVPAACRTTLPGPWRAALAAAPTTIDGRPAYAQAVASGGRLITEWIGTDRVDHVALISPSGRITALDEHSHSRIYDRYDADDADLVLSSSRNFPIGNPDAPVDDVEVIDLSTLHRSRILGKAPIPSGWRVTTGAVVQEGQVYLAVAPATRNPTTGAILRYTIATGRFARVARVRGAYPEVDHDVRGVGWPGGSVRARSVPPGLPPFFTVVDGAVQYQQVVSDGRAAAWTLRSDPFVVHWTAGDGDVRAFTVQPETSPDPAFTPTLSAVSGRFVTLQADDTGDPNVVVDAVTSAFAPTTNRAEQVFGTPDTLLFGSSADGVVRVDTAHLPALTC